MNEYLKIMGFQLNLELESNSKCEYNICNDYYKKQMTDSFDLIDSNKPELVIYPELAYSDSYYEEFRQLSFNRLIVVGSIYRENINTTIVFLDGSLLEFPKLYASNQEPMVRYIEKIDTETATHKLTDHIFYFSDKKIVILNCMEYYNLAYYLAREDKDIFALICPCCNNKMNLFKMESQAIHNHNENIYSIVVNSFGTYNGENFATGESYIYGPIQRQEKMWLMEDGITNDNHNSSILNMGDGISYFYGEFTNNLKRFGRSDDYINNPQKVRVLTMG